MTPDMNHGDPTGSDDTAAAVDVDESQEAGDPITKETLGAILEDAPADHEANTRARYNPGVLAYQTSLRTGAQTTLPATGGSKNAASRIARLVYVKWSESANKDGALKDRDALHALIRGVNKLESSIYTIIYELYKQSKRSWELHFTTS